MEARIDHITAEGIDRKRLHLARQRFRAVNAARLERLLSVLAEPHRAVVELLPLLLHDNHPSLPGYVSAQTPCGVTGFTPDKGSQIRARALFRTYQSVNRVGSEAEILGIYFIGSTGTIGQSSTSDLDVWVCYPESLPANQLALLARKTALLTEWAKSLHLEMQIFLMNAEKFRRGQREPLTGENCGTAQHFLLLDEFYRTGIKLAGRLPGWWLVPPEYEAEHAEFVSTLTNKRYFKATELVDFGGIAGIPGAEFIGAGIWQLFKAIESPYKSVLKLLLIEVYAASYPDASCLSADFKRAIYAGIVDIDELDPYVLLYRRLEHYLQERNEPGRLELVRRCFYYKGGKKLSRSPERGVKSWQRMLMERLVTDWGWDAHKLRQLDDRQNWNITQVISERRELVAELTRSYRFLSDFSRTEAHGATIDEREMNILGRKLYAAFERKSGKVEVLNPGSEINVTEAELSFCCEHGDLGQSRWSVYAELVPATDSPSSRPLKSASGLSELMCWCIVNGVYGEKTRIAVRQPLDRLGYFEAENMLRTLRTFVLGSETRVKADDHAFVEPVRPLRLLMLVNVAVDPQEDMRLKGLHRISNRTDSLGFSATRENLVRNIELIACNSWGEIICSRYEGKQGLLRCVRDYIQLGPQSSVASRPRIEVHSFCASRPQAIAGRIQELFDDIDMDFDAREQPRDGRYVLEIEETLYLISRHDQKVSTELTGDEIGLMRALAEPQARWSTLTVDRYALSHSPLPRLTEYIKPDVISVFCETRSEFCIITVIDERGSVFSSPYLAQRETTALAATDQFLHAIQSRQESLRPIADGHDQARYRTRYFRLAKDARKAAFSITPLAIKQVIGGAHYLRVQAIASRDEQNRTMFSVYIGDRSFHESTLGASFHTEVARHIISLRANALDYPVYINDLDLSALDGDIQPSLQTIHYLRYKYHIESLINEGLKRHASD